ncbi:MAG: DUF47 family protein [Rhodanobacteraceae bacterium]|nr:DUF47 family protein [Rhodanobacteraceae bacterium]MBK7044505.1 DUF47 family protein [Rhodanobacteraceae bacterium]MBP9154323.1 DUF47 family protein [Xanthomonadales bacterium]HQW81333.1 DUF47 family protein [Pseudomonadota bacterium]
MFSLQTIFGKGDRFFSLLEQSAEAAHESTKALTALLGHQGKSGSLAEFTRTRNREKELAAQISHELINTFVTAIEREDIEALSAALYKIPKAVEKFAERYALTTDRVGQVDFAPRAAMLEKAAGVVVRMVRELRRGMAIETYKAMYDELQAIESEADRLILDLYRELYKDEADPVRYLIRKDLFEIIEKAIDRCRDAGNVVYHIVLKNS